MASTNKTLTDALAERNATPLQFKVLPFYSREGDFLSICLTPDRYYCERIDETLTVYRSFSTDEVVGCKIKGVSILFERVVRTIRVVDEQFDLSFLLLNAVGKVDGNENLYYDVSDRCGTVRIPLHLIPKNPGGVSQGSVLASA